MRTSIQNLSRCILLHKLTWCAAAYHSIDVKINGPLFLIAKNVAFRLCIYKQIRGTVHHCIPILLSDCIARLEAFKFSFNFFLGKLLQYAESYERMELSKNSNKNLIDGVIDFTSGSIGSVALVYVGQPLDTVKVKMQTFPTLYKGMWDCLARTFKSEGVRRGLYAGTIPALAANVAENSVLFAAYGACQKVMTVLTNTSSVSELSVLSNASAGFLAAFFSSFSLCPTELIKVRMQAATELTQHNPKVKRKTAFQLTYQILQNEGIRGLFRGLIPTMAREMPGYFFFFGGYEGTRYLLSPGQKKEDCGPLVTMLAGAVGGSFLWTAVFPADVVKSRVQAGKMEGSLLRNTITIFKNEGDTLLDYVDFNDLADIVEDQLQQEIWTAPLEAVDKISNLYLEGRLRNIFMQEKLKENTHKRILALYNGLLPTIIRTIPSTAVLFLVYESSKHVLHSLVDETDLR